MSAVDHPQFWPLPLVTTPLCSPVLRMPIYPTSSVRISAIFRPGMELVRSTRLSSPGLLIAISSKAPSFTESSVVLVAASGSGCCPTSVPGSRYLCHLTQSVTEQWPSPDPQRRHMYRPRIVLRPPMLSTQAHPDQLGPLTLHYRP